MPLNLTLNERERLAYIEGRVEEAAMLALMAEGSGWPKGSADELNHKLALIPRQETDRA